MKNYQLPDSIGELFKQGENVYSFTDYSEDMGMNNNESMEFFLYHIEAKESNIVSNEGTQVILSHPDYEEKYTIDSGGLGDFFSHGFDVTLYEESND